MKRFEHSGQTNFFSPAGDKMELERRTRRIEYIVESIWMTGFISEARLRKWHHGLNLVLK